MNPAQLTPPAVAKTTSTPRTVFVVSFPDVARYPAHEAAQGPWLDRKGVGDEHDHHETDRLPGTAHVAHPEQEDAGQRPQRGLDACLELSRFDEAEGLQGVGRPDLQVGGRVGRRGWARAW
jgi:hypothetical protein